MINLREWLEDLAANGTDPKQAIILRRMVEKVLENHEQSTRPYHGDPCSGPCVVKLMIYELDEDRHGQVEGISDRADCDAVEDVIR